MYEAFYGLTTRPFSTVPDAHGIHWSDGHAEAHAVLHYGLTSRAPITLLTGEAGTGKTTLIGRLLAELPEDLAVCLVSSMPPGQGPLLDWIMLALGQPLGACSGAGAFARFRDLVMQRRAEGRGVLIVVDEAQSLDAARLEELRLLTNIAADGEGLVQLVLAGQPKLRALMAEPGLRQVAQRVAADCHLDPLSAGETARYIAARLRAAGARRPVFTAEACALVHDAAGGVPRLVNILCDLALVYGYAAERATVGEDLPREVLEAARTRGTYGAFAPEPRPLTLVPGGGEDAAGPAHVRRKG